MTTATEKTTLTTDHSRAVADGAHSHGLVPQGSRAERVTSFDLADIPVPTGREEEWRFSPVARLQPLFSAELGADGVRTTVTAAPEVKVETVGRDDERLGKAGKPGDRTAVTAWNAFTEATVVTIPAEAVASDVTTVRVDGVSKAATATHVLIRAEKFSQAVVVLDHDGDALLDETVEIVVEDGAHLTVVSVQDWSDDAVHLSHHQARVGRDATYKHAAISFGGDVVRMDANVTYDGPGGSAELLGLYFADAGQHIEHRIFADHTAPRTKSHAVYKGALQGEKAHTVWVGNVLIRKVAEGIETYEENRNLVLTDGCQADSVPNLEIETGEIEGAGHASATARFDDEQLFYLRSRGVSEKEAQRLVVHGFFNDLIRKVGIPSIEEKLLETVEAELAKNVLKEVVG